MAEDTKSSDGSSSAATESTKAATPDSSTTSAQESGARSSESKSLSRADRRAKIAKGGKMVKAGSNAVRNRIASIVWLLAVIAAVILATGALLIALDANQDNAIVDWVLDAAHAIDGPFWKVFEFTEENASGQVVTDETKEVLVNWGLAAIAYLVAGRILDRVIRP
ncbi:MAG: hypothetical protein ACRDO2_04750 [Nocardioidaceae bacterium]